MLRFKCYGLRFEWLKLKLNSGFYPREGRYAVVVVVVVETTVPASHTHTRHSLPASAYA